MDVLEGYFKRLCISGATDRIAALQDQIRGLTAQLADQQTTLYYSEAANLRLTTQLAEQSNVRDDRAALQAEHSDLRDDKAALQKQLQQAQDVIGALQEQLTATRLRSTRGEQQLLLEQNRNRPLRNQVAAADGQIAQMQRQLTALVDQHTAQQNAQLQRRLNDLVAQHRSELNQQEWRLTYQLQTLQTQLDDITRRIIGGAPPAMAVPVRYQPGYAYQSLQTALHLTGILRITVSLDLADLSVRSHNILKRGGIQTLNDLLTRTPDHLLSFRNSGPHMLKSLSEKWVRWGRRHIMRPPLLFWWGVPGLVRPSFVVQRADIRPFQTSSNRSRITTGVKPEPYKRPPLSHWVGRRTGRARHDKIVKSLT